VLRAAPRSAREPPGELLFVPPSFDAAFGDGTAPLSALPPGLLRVGAPPRALDAALARDVKTVDFVGYVANPAYRRGLPRGAAAAAVAPLRNARVARRRDAADRAAAVGAGAGRRRPAAASPLPAAYLYTEARAAHAASAPRAAFDYDFSAFNATRLAGLENDLADAYVNPLLQALLRGAPHLRTALLRHVCDREFCARCELGFLAHALARQPPGGAARPANLLRALRQIREAGALGLLEGTDEPGARPDACLPRRVQALARFLLEQLAKEETAAAQAAPKDSGQAAVERLFGAQVCTTTTCAQCGAAAAREARSLAFDLAYASAAQGGQARPSFAAVLAASLGGAPTEVRAWCAAERAYARAASERRLRALPACLLLCCGMKDTADLRWWGVADAALRAADAAQRRAASGAADDAASYEAAETAPTQERWLPHAVRVALLASGGVAVTQADSPALLGPRGAHAAAGESAAAVYRLMAVVARVRPRSGEAEPTGASGAEAAQRAEGHLVAHVRVTPPDVPRRGAFLRGSDADDAAPAATPGVSPLPAPGAGLAARAAAQAPPPPRPSTPEAPEATPADAPLPDAPTPRTPARPEGLAAAAPAESPGREASSAEGVSDWVLFNDFAVTPTAACEPAQLYGAAKQPCLLLFQRLEAGEAAEPPALAPPAPAAPSPLTEALYARLLRARPPPPGASYRPLDLASEAPRAGMLVGIDAEFVALSAAETSVRPDGSAAVLRPARLGPARVSVVRGAGPSAGVTLQDDYVRPVEAVHDYLTRYSGLQPADLDPAAARHGGNVTTLKAAYLKLRYLADAGCVFCGHGLLSDFRCLNMAVPATQIVDTVELFHFKRQRKLGLRFLARFLLGAHIQRGSHDSVEDARTALALYAKYLRLQRRGTLQATLLELYRFGKTHGWDGNAPDAVWPPVQPDDDEPAAAV
jgi:PAB-dependent poly(A)-specific ribonuclease subunit 2